MIDNIIEKLKKYLPKPENEKVKDLLYQAIREGEIKEGYLIRIVLKDGRDEHVVYVGKENDIPYFMYGNSQKLTIGEIVDWEVL